MRKILLLSMLFVCFKINKSVAQCTPPTISPITGSSAVCSGTPQAYIVTSSPDAWVYNWSVTGGTANTSKNDGTITITWGAAGVGSISVFVTNSAGCKSSTSSLPITINSVPVTPLQITGPNYPCANSNSAYTLGSGNPGSSYHWSYTGGTQTVTCPTCITTGVTWDPVSVSHYGSVKVYEVNSAGCAGPQAQLDPWITALPVTGPITGNTSVCGGLNGSQYSITPTSTSSTFTWSVVGGTIVGWGGSANNPVTVNWGNDGTVPASVQVVESINGCGGAPVNLPVKINSISASSTSLCVGGNVTLTPSSGVTWTSSNTSIATVTNSGIVTGVAPGNVTLMYNLASAGCSQSINLTVLGPITSSIIGKYNVCNNSSGVTYSVTNVAGNTYAWTVTGGGSIVTGNGTNGITVNWGAAGTGTVKVLETNSTGCSGVPVTIPITIYGTPNTSQITGGAACQFVANNYVYYYVSGSPGSTYIWTATGGTPYTTYSCGGGWGSPIGTCYANVSGIPTPSSGVWVAWTGSGPGTLSVVETNAGGCVGQTLSLPVTITLPSVSTPTNQMCLGSSITLSPSTGGTWLSNIPSFASVTNSGVVTALSPGPASFTYTQSSTGCPSVTLNISIGPKTVMDGYYAVCASGSGAYSVANGGAPGSTYNWSITGGTQTSGGTSGNILVNWGNGSSGNVSVVETTASGCIGNKINFPVTINPTPTVTAPANSLCLGNTMNLSSSLAGTWLSSSPSVATVSSSGVVTAISNGVAVFTLTSNSGCSAQTPYITIGSGGYTFSILTSSAWGIANACANSSMNYSLSPSHSGSTYAWTVIGGNVTSGAGTSNVWVTWDSPATGNLKVVETTSGGCAGYQTSVPVNIVSNPSTSQITGNTNVCPNSTGIAYSVSNTSGSTYAWTISGGAVASGQGMNSIIVNWGAVGAGNVKVVETNASGCLGVAVNRPVSIGLPSTSAITGLTPVCANTSGVVYSVTNTTGSSYAWTVTGTTGSTLVSGNGTNSIIVNWGAAGTGTVKVTETNTFGCVGVTMTKSVTINANPLTSAITGSATACPNATGIAYSVTNTVGSTYNWNITGGVKAFGGTTNSITVNWGTGGSGNVSVVETNSAGCVGTIINKPVTVSPLTSSIAGSFNVCPNSNGVAYSVANVTGDTYTWTAIGGTVVCGQNTSTILVNWGAAGPGTLNVTERSATCTGVAVSLPVAITPSPATSAITGNAAVCAYSTGVQYSVINTASSTYAWIVSGGTIVSGNNTNTVSVNWGAIGTGNISVVETSGTGCIGTAVNKIVSITSVSTGIITGSTSMCLPANGITYSVPNTSGNTYTWTVNGGNMISGAGTNSITVNWTLAGPGLVSVVETNSAGCVGNVVAQPVQVNPKPATSAITGNSSVCPNATGVSYSVTNTPGSTYVWTISGGGTQASGGNSNNISVNWGGVGTGNVSVLETNNFACVGIAVNLPVTINALPTITVSPASATIPYGGSVSLTASGASTYSWSPPTGLNTTTGATVTASPSASTTYTVTGTDSRGCVNTKTVPVSLTCTPPSVFIGASNGLNLCKVSSTTLTATAISGATYTWTSSYGDYSKTGTTTNGGNTLLVYDEETYTVTVNASGCIGSASTTTYRTGTLCNAIARVAPGSQLTKPTESEDEPKGHKISVHPNPANHEVIVETPWRAERDTQVVLYDMMGRVSGSGILKKGEWTVTISTAEVANGMYVVRIGTGDQANAEKVIIEHK